MRAPPRVARSASSITAWRTAATSASAATAIASSTRLCFTPMRMSPSISLSRYFASSGVARRSRPSTSAARTAVVRAAAIAANASATSASVKPSRRTLAVAASRSNAAAPRSPCRRYAAVSAASVRRRPPAPPATAALRPRSACADRPPQTAARRGTGKTGLHRPRHSAASRRTPPRSRRASSGGCLAGQVFRQPCQRREICHRAHFLPPKDAPQRSVACFAVHESSNRAVSSKE